MLEKSRVVQQSQGERSFHIFYQLLAGASSSEKSSLRLSGPDAFKFLNQSGSYTVEGVKDAEEFKHTVHAMSIVGIPSGEQQEIWRLIAGILHLGNLTFKAKGNGTEVSESRDLDFVASLFGTNGKTLESCLCNRHVSRGGPRASSYQVPLKPEEAAYSRDALAKAIYSR